MMMETLDIFQPDCVKKTKQRKLVPCPNPCTDEVEIFSVGEEEERAEEEQSMDLSEQDCKNLWQELECLKKRVQFLQRKMKTKYMEPCPDEPCVDPEIELNCSPNVEVCALQKQQYRLQCQLNELVRSATLVRDMIKDLRERMCQKSREIVALQKEIASLNSWRVTLEHEFGVCIERFEYLKHVKAEWADVDEFKKYLTLEHMKLRSKFVPQIWFQRERMNILTEFCCIKKLLSEYMQQQSEQYMDLRKMVLDVKSQVDDLTLAGEEEAAGTPPSQQTPIAKPPATRSEEYLEDGEAEEGDSPVFEPRYQGKIFGEEKREIDI